jgi:hypothetical protein
MGFSFFISVSLMAGPLGCCPGPFIHHRAWRGPLLEDELSIAGGLHGDF